jgi:hypothetical protein
MNESELIAAIVDLLDGVEWRADTASDIAGLLTANGYRIRDLDDRDLSADMEPRFFRSLACASQHMGALDYDGDSYVVESVKLASGVVLRAKVGAGFSVHLHGPRSVVLSCFTGSTDGDLFEVPAARIASLVVQPL